MNVCICYLSCRKLCNRPRANHSNQSTLLRGQKLINHSSVIFLFIKGIKDKTGMRTQEEMKKVTEMVKQKNYNHK
jgi:hypothetical protein